MAREAAGEACGLSERLAGAPKPGAPETRIA